MISTKDSGKSLSGTFNSEYPIYVEGEIVVLKSGGPDMTIIEVIDETDEVVVAFASLENGIDILGFPSVCVRKVPTK